MDIDGKDAAIHGIHNALEDDQGLITVENGTTDRGYQYIYTIVKSHISKEVPAGITYILRADFTNGTEYWEINGDFTETGMTGMRDSVGLQLAMQAGLVEITNDGQFTGWAEDPYDPEYKKGLLMNLSEREGLDGLFPDHPLSQAREFVHALLFDELMLPPAEPDDNETADEENVTEEEETDMMELLFSKDTHRNFTPDKVIIKDNATKVRQFKDGIGKAIDQSAAILSTGTEYIKSSAKAAKAGLGKTGHAVQDKSREVQMNVLMYIDQQKNKKYVEAKASAFKDGINQGKLEMLPELKKYINYYLAVAALSFYFARCDGDISEAERQEIDYNLKDILRNKDLPDSIFAAITSIAENAELSFDTVTGYLDRISVESVAGLIDDAKEIILADGDATEAEKIAEQKLLAYLDSRKEVGNVE